MKGSRVARPVGAPRFVVSGDGAQVASRAGCPASVTTSDACCWISAVWDLLRRNRVLELAAMAPERVSMRDRRGLERVLDTALWLDSYRPELRLARA